MALELRDGGRTSMAAAAWTDPRSFATTLVHLFHDQYYDAAAPAAENCYTWHPETVAREIRDDFRVELPRANFDRLMTGLWLIRTDEFYRRVPAFVEACVILSGGTFDPGTFDPADAAECAWGVTEALLLAPPEDDDDDEPFAPEVVGYIGRALDEEGIIHPPDVLRLGARAGDPAARVQADFADDPEMFAAISRVEGDKTREINDLVRTNLAELLGQLVRLPLRHGDAAGLAGRLARTLG